MKTLVLILVAVLCVGTSHAQTFQSPIRVNPDASGARQAAPQMKVDRMGTIYVAWSDFRTNSGGDLVLSRSTDRGATFSTPVPFRTGGTVPSGMQRGVQMAIDPSGGVHMVWMETRTGQTSDLLYCRTTDGGATFTTPRSIAGDSARHNQDFPSIAVDSSGRVYVAWVDDREARNGTSNHTQIYFTRSTDGGASFSAPKRANIMPAGVGGSCECCNTSIGASDFGDVYISFRSNVNDMRDIWVARSLDRGETFDVSIPVASENWPIDACPMTGSSIAVGNDGWAYVAWRDSRPSSKGRDYIYFSKLGSDAAIAEIDKRISNTPSRSNYPSLVLEPDGTLFCAFQDNREDEFGIYITTSSDRGATFTPESKLTIESTPSNQSLPIVAVGAAGERYIVWEDDRRDAGDIAFARDLSKLQASVRSSDDASFSFELSTNVATRGARVTASVVARGRARITLHDVTGAVVRTVFDGDIDRGSTVDLDLGGIASGTYFIRLMTATGVVERRFILTR